MTSFCALHGGFLYGNNKHVGIVEQADARVAGGVEVLYLKVS